MAGIKNLPVNAERVVFSAGSEVFVGDVGASEASLARLCMLADDVSLNLSPTIRTARGGYPRVPVAESVGEYNASFSFGARELSQSVLLLATGLAVGDLVVTPGADVNIADEVKTFNAQGVAYLNKPAKIGAAIVVEPIGGGAAFAAGTDYVVIPRDANGNTIIFKPAASTIPGAGAQVDYVHAAPASEEYDLAARSVPAYKQIKFIENLTDGGQLIGIMPKARVGLSGEVALNRLEPEMTIPISVTPLYDTTSNKFVNLRRVY
jgi:hypothetical protein